MRARSPTLPLGRGDARTVAGDGAEPDPSRASLVAAMRFVLLGEPATGKSSLLVAFYGALMHRRAGDMEISRTVDEVEFLSRGLEAFGRRQELWRTELDADARLVLELTSDGAAVGLELPDRSGELIKHMIDTRTWNHELREQVTQANGAMLFLRADEFAGLRADDAADVGQADDAATQTFLEPPTARADQPEERSSPSPGLPGTTISTGTSTPPRDPTGQWAQEIAAAEQEPGASSEPWPTVEPPPSPPPIAAWQASTAEVNAEDEETPWSPALMPADVRAIDLLQALLEERSVPLPSGGRALRLRSRRRAAARHQAAWVARVRAAAGAVPRQPSRPAPPCRLRGFGAGHRVRPTVPWTRVEDRDPWDRAFLVGADGLRARSPSRSSGSYWRSGLMDDIDQLLFGYRDGHELPRRLRRDQPEHPARPACPTSMPASKRTGARQLVEAWIGSLAGLSAGAGYGQRRSSRGRAPCGRTRCC